MKLFIGTITSDYEETEWITAVAESIEEAKKNILKDIAQEWERSIEEVDEEVMIDFLMPVDEVNGYKITLTKS